MKIDLGHIHEVSCVTVQLDGERTTYNFTRLKKSKGEIAIGRITKKVASVKELAQLMTTRYPVLVHFAGKGILNRKVNYEENYRHAILLNAQASDFYFTDYIAGKTVHSSVIRKSVVEEVNSEFARHKLNVIGISSGPFITVPFAGFFDKSTYQVDDTEIAVEKNAVVSFRKTEDTRGFVLIGADRVDHDLLGAVALGANYFNPVEGLSLSNEEPGFMVNLQAAKQRNIFYRFGMAMMVFFLVLLTGNYFYLGYLNDQIEDNYAVLSGYEDQLAELSTLGEEKDRKENLLRSSGLLNKQFLSFYLMKLSHSIPAGITFDAIDVRPLVDEIKKKQKIEFYDHSVLVSGYTRTSEMLSKWIERLKQEEWLSKVDILDYTYEKNAGHFELEMIVF